MKIVVVGNYLASHLGGIEVVMDQLATEFVRRGHDVTTIAAEVPSVMAAAPAQVAAPLYRTIGVPAFNGLEERAGVPFPLPHPRLVKVLRDELADADILFAHGYLCVATSAALAVARSLGARRPARVLIEHVGFIRYRSKVLAAIETAAIRTLGLGTLKLAHGCLVNNPRVGDELRALAPEKPVEWVPNGVDLSKFRPAEPGERDSLRRELGWDDRLRVLFVGRFVERKGLDVVLDVARQGAGAFDVVLVGRGTLSHAMPPHVQVIGSVPPERVAQLYRAADAFLLPSYGEGFPLTVLEALASGCPALLGEDPAFARHLDGVGQGVQQVPLDATDITGRLRGLFSSGAARKAAAQDGLAHVRRLTWERMATDHLAFAEKLRRG